MVSYITTDTPTALIWTIYNWILLNHYLINIYSMSEPERHVQEKSVLNQEWRWAYHVLLVSIKDKHLLVFARFQPYQSNSWAHEEDVFTQAIMG